MPTARCPHCRAAVTLDAPWCGQCYASLVAPAPPAPPAAPLVPPPPLPAAPAGAAAPAPPGAAAPAPPGPTWPCSRCGERNDVADDRCRACTAPFLADVEATDVVVPVLGALRGMTKGRRLAVSAGGAFAVTAVLVAGFALVGSLL